MKNEKVTIIMATYNRAHFIEETLNSIQNQTFKEWECIIIDDGGTDHTAEIIKPFLYKDKRFSFFKRPERYTKGLPGCRNYGLDVATGNYIIFFDDDDIVHPQNLECCILELENKEISFCRYIREVFTGEFNYKFDYSKNYTSFTIDVQDLESVIKNELPFNSCAVMWRKKCFQDFRFVEHLMYAEEWELYTRLLSTNIKGISIAKCLFYGRKHANSNTGEFYTNNPIRRASKKEAIVLVLKNLKDKDLLTNSILRYLIQLSLSFKEYNLFNQMMQILGFPLLIQLKWRFFYLILPLRLKVYKKIKRALIVNKIAIL